MTKNWTEGDLAHLLSAKNVVNITILVKIGGIAGFFDAREGRARKVLADMADSLKSYPALTSKQANYAADLLKKEHGLQVGLVQILNFAEQRGEPVTFIDNIAGSGTPVAKPDIAKLQEKACELASVSIDGPPATSEEVAREWGLF